MSTPTRPLDPEIGAILAEVAGDPRAHLLRVPELRVPLVYEAPVGSGAPGLTAAERQLVSVHRADVAQILLEAAHRDLYLRPTPGFAMHHEITVDRRVELQDERSWHARARRVAEVSGITLADSEPLELLAACVEPRSDRVPGAVSLAVASLRLVPRTETRINLALALEREGRSATARRVLLGVVGDRPSQLNLSFAWNEIGNCEWDLGHMDAARGGFEAAAATREVLSVPVINLFALCFELGDEEGATRVANRLQTLVDADHASVTEFIESRQATRRSTTWSPPGAGLSPAVMDRLPPTARRVAHALE